MSKSRTVVRGLLVAGISVGVLAGGCGVGGGGALNALAALEDLEVIIARAVNIIQGDDPRRVVLPDDFAGRGNTIIIADDVDIIVDVSDDLVYAELPDITLFGVENASGDDVYLTYRADGDLQGVFVYAGETLLLEYPCLGLIQLISEEDYDPFTGVFLDEFDLVGGDFVNPLDFECAEALIITIDPLVVIAEAERIRLID